MRINTFLCHLCLAVVLLVSVRFASAMNLNLASAYDDKPTPPQTANLSFYSRQSEDMLFVPDLLKSKKALIQILCQSGLRAIGLKWTLHRNMVKKTLRQGEATALPANQFQIDITPEGLPAGFYDLRVTLDTGLDRKVKDGKPVTRTPQNPEELE